MPRKTELFGAENTITPTCLLRHNELKTNEVADSLARKETQAPLV